MGVPDAAYSADGRFVAAAVEGSGERSFVDTTIVDTAVAVWDAESPQQPVRRLQPLHAFAVELSADGRLLYVATREPALAIIDVATGETLRSVPLYNAWIRPAPDGWSDIYWALSDALTLSPDGTTLAVAEGNDIRLFRADDLSPIRSSSGTPTS